MDVVDNVSFRFMKYRKSFEVNEKGLHILNEEQLNLPLNNPDGHRLRVLK